MSFKPPEEDEFHPAADNPRYISKNGWVFGFDANGHRLLWDPAHALVSLPSDGTVDWVDDQDRLNGHYMDGQTYRRAVWLRRVDSSGAAVSPVQYDRHDYLPLQPPHGWTTNHEVAPGTRSLQVGILSRTDGSEETRGFVAFQAELAVDGNRDGKIELSSESSADEVTREKPFRFWSNDDIDRDNKDLTAGHDPDWKDGLIQCTRDLEDFARIQISLGGLREAFVAGNLRLGLEWKQATAEPSIQIYPQMDQTGSNDYLKNEQEATAQIKPGRPTGRWALQTQSGATLIGVGQPLVLPLLGDDEYFPGFLSTGLMPLLFEGCTEGKGRLCLTIHDANGVKIGDGPGVWIEIKNIKAMYERARAKTNYAMSPNGIDYTMPLPHDTLSTQPPEPTMGWEPDDRGVSFVPDPNENTTNKNYVIFVHGWRMSPDKINTGAVGYGASTTFAETMFKRLWHTGYRGRFSAFRWPTFYGGPSPDDDFIAGYSTYNNSEYRAWKSGESLKQYVNELPSDFRRNIAAHSMGNIVVGSAFLKGLEVDRYMMLNAAVPAIAYDDQAPRNSPVLTGITSIVGGYDDPTQVPTPNDDPDSSVKSKAYVNQLQNIGGGDTRIVNFYLAADDATLSKWNANNVVLRPHAMAWPKSPGYSYNPSAAYSKLKLAQSNTQCTG